MRRLEGEEGRDSSRPSAKVLPGVANAGVVGREGVVWASGLGRMDLGVALPALHPPKLVSSCGLCTFFGGVPALDSAFILSINVSMTLKSSCVMG